ncbi:MAG: hypothetical protein WC860_04665 [Candidatus Margulisiibacteriota bacterium]|jgi:hypothetical protein
MTTKNQIFPIIYNEYSINEQVFNIAVEKIMQKFDLSHERAIELTEDIIKAMILENKPANNLEHEIDGLVYSNWHYLRYQSIEEIIKNKKIKF